MQNTFKLVENVLLNPNVKASDIAVFFSLFSRMGTKGYCYPSVDTIVRETGYSERAVQLSTKRLEEQGYISKIERKSKGKQYSNYYCLCPEQNRHFDEKNENMVSDQNTRVEELHKNTKDVDLREEICRDEDFLKFIDQYSVEINQNYKLAALTFIERKLRIDKRENTFLMYSILMADREAFMYFTIERLAKRLSMATSRVRDILSSLKEQGYIKLITKTIKGKEICLIRINVELLDCSVMIRKKLSSIIQAKKQTKFVFFIFTVTTNIHRPCKGGNLATIIFFNHWLSVHLRTARIIIDFQMIGRHNLFDKVFAP